MTKLIELDKLENDCLIGDCPEYKQYKSVLRQIAKIGISPTQNTINSN